MGYVLPWGQMSLWGATVITNLFSAIPVFGEFVVTWLWGGYSVGNPTLQRFFSLHYLLPFVLAGVVVLHIWALHVAGQNNPTGVEPKSDKDTVPFTPYATLKDAFFIVVFCILYAWFVFYLPNYHGPCGQLHSRQSGRDAGAYRARMVLPAVLRDPARYSGPARRRRAMFASIAILLFLPWLDTSKVRSAVYRPMFRIAFWVFFAACIGLGWLGAKPAEGWYVIAARLLTIYYFAHFLVVLPLLGLIEKTKPLPNSISEAVLAGKGKTVASIVLMAMLFGAGAFTAPSAQAAEQVVPPRYEWSFSGPFGSFDRGQLQRGLKVYREVCAACHGLSRVSFRNLAQPGGPGFSPAQAAAIAAEYQITDGPNDEGEMFQRAGQAADRFPSPFPNEKAARAAQGGAYPLDLSLIAKARTYERGFPWFIFDFVTQYQEQGPDYLTALLLGYEKPPEGFKLPPGSNYNRYFPGHAIGMPPPLTEGAVEYTDGTPPTVENYAKDVTAFLTWAAEPHMEARKRLGLQVMIFLLVLGGLLYFTKRKVWSTVEGH